VSSVRRRIVAMPYDPFLRGSRPVGVRTMEARDAARDRLFSIETWYPAEAKHAGQDLTYATQDAFVGGGSPAPRKQRAVRDANPEPGRYPLIVFSHASGHHRRGATFLCTHLASHGYVVAALDHSEVVAPELARREGETAEQRAGRVQSIIESRVPDIRFLLDWLLGDAAHRSEIDSERIAIVGHSFGGWTALATPETDARIRAVVALAPGGSSLPKPGIIPAALTFDWGRDVPTLYLTGDRDIFIPLAAVRELYERTPATKRMLALRRADHLHFMDRVEEEHEASRKLPWTGDLAWVANEIRPIAELCSGEHAHLFTRGLALAHMDAVLRASADARGFLDGDVEAELGGRGVDAFVVGRERGVRE
jgi:predicted dienelactone hydrolase